MNTHTTTPPQTSNIYQKFLSILTQSGILLMLATVVAVVWANSPWGDSYEQLWHHTYFTIGFDKLQLHKHLIHWINDGLMAIFFFVVGLEIKREIIAGELKTVKKAALPCFAALGGMVVPVLIFSLFGLEGEGASGWGIPMATDIAFSLAILALLGSRVPLSLKIFLTALAIVDDLGAVLVIALFYTSTINWTLLVTAILLVGLLFFLNKRGIQNLWYYTLIGLVVWLLFLFSGIHATIAGVLIAFTIPVYPRVKMSEFTQRISQTLGSFSPQAKQEDTFILTEGQLDGLDQLKLLSEKVQSPLQRLEHDLGRLVNYFILPLFALSNAGVAFAMHNAPDDSLNTPETYTGLGVAIAISLVFGKTIGISLFTWLAIKLKLADKPEGGTFGAYIGLGLLGGIGFTMSLFITTLAFTNNTLINEAKIGIFIGSLIAGIIGFAVLRYVLRPKR